MGPKRNRSAPGGGHRIAALTACTLLVAMSGRAGAETGEAPVHLDELDFLGVGDEIALLFAEDVDVVVSATRHAQPIAESPSAITVIGREEILASGYDNLVDLMRLVPGADVSRVTPFQGAVGVRTRTSLAGNLLLVLVDGRDVSLHMFGQPMWMAMPFDVESVERIEVIRGPGSTLYGANAYQGVVNIVTRRPAEMPFTGEATASAAGVVTHQAEVRTHGRSGDFGWWASAGYDSRAPHARPDERAFRLGRARLLGEWTPADGVLATAEVGVVAVEGTFVSPVGGGGVQTIWPYLRGTVETDHSELLLVLDRNDVTMDVDFRVILPDDDGGEGQVLVRSPPLRLPTHSVALAGHHTLLEAAGHRLTTGGTVRLVHHRPVPIVTCPENEPQDFDPNECVPLVAVEPRVGAFFQDEWRITDDLLANVGLRLDWNALNPQLGVSPRLALVWRMVDGQSIRLAAGRAYRKPTFLESHGRILPDGVDGVPEDVTLRLQHLFATGIGNPDLGNEHVDAVEIGWRGRFLGGRVSASVETFLAHHGDTIVAYTENIEFTTGLGGVPVLHPEAELGHRNSDMPRVSYGGEAVVEGWVLPRALMLRATYALDVQYERQPHDEDDPAAGTFWHQHRAWEPVHRLGGTLRWTSPMGFHGSVDAFWMSRYITRTQDPASALLPREEAWPGATTLVNATIGYRQETGFGDLAVGASALNVLVQPVREVGGSDPHIDRLDPRVRLWVRARF